MCPRLGLGVASDDESVESELHFACARGIIPHIDELLGDADEVTTLLKYQSEYLPAFWRAAAELPPWNSSGFGRSGV